MNKLYLYARSLGERKFKKNLFKPVFSGERK